MPSAPNVARYGLQKCNGIDMKDMQEHPFPMIFEKNSHEHYYR